MSDGYSINMRQVITTGEHLAVVPHAYKNRHGERYYMAMTLTDGWVELAPEYVTRYTRTAAPYDEALKRTVDRNLGYILSVTDRLKG